MQEWRSSACKENAVVALHMNDRRLRAEFVAFLPELRRVLRAKFRHLDAEARGESISEAIAFAFGVWLSAKRRAKAVGVYSLCSFAALLVKSGRKFAGERQTDILSEAGRVMGKVPPVARFGFGERLDDLLLEDRRNGWPVPDRVAFKLDWAAYLDRQPRRTRQIIDLLGQGHLRKEAAAALRITPPAVSMRMNNAYRAWQNFGGEAAC